MRRPNAWQEKIGGCGGLEGTAVFVIFMSGLGFFGSAVRHLVLMNLSEEEDGQS